MTSTTKIVATTAVAICLTAAAGAGLFAVSGLYNFAADEPHFAWVHSTLETMRERSIETRAAKLTVPDLSDPARVVSGAGNYAAMCASCHLTPDAQSSELSRGLYPQPPNLSKERVDAAHAFWVIKHGVKASGMPAWGKSMDDDSMWSIVAFLQKLPQMDDSQYDKAVGSSSGHSHGGEHASLGEHSGPESVGKEGHVHADEAAQKSSEAPAGTHTHANGKVHKHDRASTNQSGRPAPADVKGAHP